MDKEILFLDTEFNGSKFDGYGGELLSMGIVSGSDSGIEHRFYQAIKYSDNDDDLWKDLSVDPWVKENVLPYIFRVSIEHQKKATSYREFQEKLEKFLSRFPNGFIIISDWPDDIKYFCEALITGPGEMLDIPSFEARVERVNYLVEPTIRHNALHDAIALKKTLLKMHKYTLFK